MQASADLIGVLDGEDPAGWDDFIRALHTAVHAIGTPCFLRTGHGSGKHAWRDTCYLADADLLERHVGALVEWSALVDIWGLPTRTWAVRELLDTAPLFHCRRYGGMPIVREFRLFVREGKVDHWQPYWPPDAAEQGEPDIENWRELLEKANRPGAAERDRIFPRFAHALRAMPGYWSVDILQDRNRQWWLTDMARGEDSFRWEP